MGESAPLCYWRELWRLTSGFSKPSSENLVSDELKLYQDQLTKGLAYFKPHSSDSYSKLAAKQNKFTKVLPFIEKLHQFMDLDAFQTWDVFCHFLSSQYHGTVENALDSFSFMDVSMNELLVDVWTFYNSERLFMLKQLRLILESKDSQHSYNKEFNVVFKAIGLDKLKTSLINQFKCLVEESAPTKIRNGDLMTVDMQKKWIERNLHEQAEILLLILLTMDENYLYTQEYKQLFNLFKTYSFGRQPVYCDYIDESHSPSIMKITYSEVAIFYKLINEAKGPNASAIIMNIKDKVESELIRLQHNEEHGALLLAWMLILLEDSMSDEVFLSKYQHFGTKALQLHVFRFLYDMCKHPMFSDKTRVGVIFRKSVYEMLTNMCNKFDNDGAMVLHPYAVELTAELLKSPDLAEDFWSRIDKSVGGGVVSIWNSGLEFFPYDFKTTSLFVSSLAQASKQSFENLLGELDDLPMFTERYKPRTVTVSNVTKDGDDVILSENHSPYGDGDFVIRARSHASIMDRRNATLIHFRVNTSYWTILYHEIQNLIRQSLVGRIEPSEHIERINYGIRALISVLKRIQADDCKFDAFVAPCEAVFDALVRFSNSNTPYTALIANCMELSTILITNFGSKIFTRLMNIKLLPYIDNYNLTFEQYANGDTLQSAIVGFYLINVEQPNGEYRVFLSYLDVITAFFDMHDNDIALGILLPGLMFILREILPNMFGWYFKSSEEKQAVHSKTISFVFKVLQLSESGKYPADELLNKTCLRGMLGVDNAVSLLKLVSYGEKNIQRIMSSETNWINGPGIEQIKLIQMSISVLLQALRLKHLIADKSTLSPLEHLIYTQPRQKDTMNIIPTVTGYINHVFNKNLPNVACRLLRRFALESRMSLLICLDMAPHQIRTMFLERLRDKTETIALKTAILEFVSVCIESQPGLTEVFFKLAHSQDDAKIFDKDKRDEKADGILTFMAEYLSAVKTDTDSLYSPLLSRIMNLFHALWKNNMQMLVKDLRQNPDFWEYLCSPLFRDILPDVKAYSQILNMMSIELYLFNGKVDESLKNSLMKLLGSDDKYLKIWLDYIFTGAQSESYDEVPAWLSLLTSWKDFMSVIMKHLPFKICSENRYLMASVCLNKLNEELDSMNDNRVIIVLAELYVIYVANWKEDLFDDTQEYVEQFAKLLGHLAESYDCLHYRACYSILAICTSSITILSYDLKEEHTSSKIIDAVCRINHLQLDKSYESDRNGAETTHDTLTMGLRLLEQCIYVFKNEFYLSASVGLINKLVFFTNGSVQKNQRYRETLAALDCLTAFSRSCVSKNLLYCDVSLNLWLKFLPPKDLSSPDSNGWTVSRWWQIYRSGIEFVTSILEKHGNYFSSEAIVFAGVHEEYLIDSLLLIRQTLDVEALNLTQSVLYFVSELIKFRTKWKHEHNQSLMSIMRAITICLHFCVSFMIRPKGVQLTVEALPTTVTEEAENVGPTPKVTAVLNKLLELTHLSSICLNAFSPNLLTLVTDPYFENTQWLPLMEIQFGPPKLSSEPYPQLTFGTVMSGICLLTRSLNHTYSTKSHVSQVLLDLNTPHSGSIKQSRKISFRRRISAGSEDDGIRRQNIRSDSVTSISSTMSTSVNAGWLMALDMQFVMVTLENLLTLLASQALLAIKDPNMSTRDKQLVRRELCAELPVFHDFVKRKVIGQSHGKNHLCRRKYGMVSLAMDDDRGDDIADESESDDSAHTPPSLPRKRGGDTTMRVSVVRKLHLQKAKSMTDEPTPSTSKSDKSRSTKHVTWDEISLSQDSSKSDAENSTYCGLSRVQMVEEDYLHFLSNIFLYICQTDHYSC